MKKNLLIFFLFTCLFAKAQWRNLHQTTDTISLTRGASFYSPSSGYFVNYNWIGFTSDTGHTIQKVYTLTNVEVNGYIGVIPTLSYNDVKAFNHDTIILSATFGLSPMILKTKNGGQSWKVVYYGDLLLNIENSSGTVSYPENGNTGFVCHGYNVLKTTNMGESWQTVYSQPTNDLLGVSFVNSAIGFAATPDKLLKTTNGGANWTTYNNLPFEIFSFDAINDQTIFINTASGDNFYSVNGGQSWIQANTEVGRFRGYINYINDTTGYCAAPGIFQTRNKGKSWEAMTTSPPGGSPIAEKFYIYNDQQIWSLGLIESIWYTSNAGGISYPRALFEANTSNVCANNTVSLINQSHQGYIYKWYRNGNLLSSVYDASYIITSGIDTIKLVVDKQGLTDSMTRVIYSTGSASLQLNSKPRKDSVCSNSAIYFDIFNSRVDVEYQVGRNGFFFPLVQGNGSTLTVYYSAPSHEESTTTFTVRAIKNGPCGTQIDSQHHIITIVNSFIDVTALPDTVCTKAAFYVRVINTRPDFNYWVDNSFPMVAGNGGTINLPHRALNEDYDGSIYKTFTIGVYAQHKTNLCGGIYQNTSVSITGRVSYANFITLGNEWFVGDKLEFKNQSFGASSSLWKFSSGASSLTSNADNPVDISFNTEGFKEVKLLAYTKEGCVDSVHQTVEVYKLSGITPEGQICPSPANGNVVDSLKGTQYFVTRSFNEDKYGNRTIVGGYTDLIFSNTPRGAEGIFAAKFNKNGDKLWFIRSEAWLEVGDDYTIAEQSVTDSLGYTYILGHSYNRSELKFYQGDTTFSLPKSCLFLLKLSPLGKPLWVKPFYIYQGLFHTKGSLLQGKNNELYIITSHQRAYQFISGDEVIVESGIPESGVIIHLDKNGKTLRKRTFPVFYYSQTNLTNNGNYDDSPPAIWTNEGQIAYYDDLDPDEITGNSIDGITIPYDISQIKSTVFLFDTATFTFKAFKPIFKLSDGNRTTVQAETLAIDSIGNYYSSYKVNQLYQPNSVVNNYDTIKPKIFISSFDPTGNLRWVKQAEGLKPNRIFVTGNKVKIGGSNYIYHPFTVGYNPIGNQSPTFDSLKKVTFLGDTSSFIGSGRHGLGSLDLTTATLNSSTGELLDILHLGSPKEDEAMILAKGFGQQLWVAGTVGSDMLDVFEVTDTISTLYTYKLPVEDICSQTFATEPDFVKLDMIPESVNCTDSIFRVIWSSKGVTNVNLYYSLNNGNTYTLLKDNINAALGAYQFDAVQANSFGNVKFKIEGVEQALHDSVSIQLYKKAIASVTINASLTSFCRGTNVTVTASPINGGINPTYQWLLNDQDQYVSGNTFITDQLHDQWQLKVILFTNAPCAAPNYTFSNTIIFSVTQSNVPTIQLSGNSTVNQGQQSVITSTIVNGGSNPAYQWQDSTANHSWQNIPGATISTLNYSAVTSGDKLRCILTSDINCPNPATVYSQPITFIVNTPTGVSQTYFMQNFLVYPNPADQTLIIDSLSKADKWETVDIISVDGKSCTSVISVKNQTQISLNVFYLKSGLYILRLKNRSGKIAHVKFIKN